ncbi:MAG: bifunctional phosphoribosylaminoimidazolecarboxamide formyltransferase/IMP cyclohydrolase [Candidatus Kinetoplastibacterium crithidii]|nr:MAG: bifunctional phosphoribosylaminoimidazolecarboxamide formyltransferase/IMP cyclohydrolase [Candidatus Kinetoplastibacterium crithidii]
MKIETALLSVSNKEGIIDFAKALESRNIRILSTGGTSKLLKESGIKVTEVSEYTGFPEMLDGRVKTLHPKIHGGLLAKRDKQDHLDIIKKYNIDKIDILAVNLYPFYETVSKDNCTFSNAIENIDIGGPAMLRSAAKNHGTVDGGVTVIVDPQDYKKVINEIDLSGNTSYKLRLELAKKVFAHTALYDGIISNYLNSIIDEEPNYDLAPSKQKWPDVITIQTNKQQSLRYGENPHQTASFYVDRKNISGLLGSYKQIQGKELSFNNIADADAAWECVRSFNNAIACVIVKHANPCGVAVASDTLEAYSKAFQTDPTSAFGGIIAFNSRVNGKTAKTIINNQFLELLIAPSYDEEAINMLSEKQNIRVLEIPIGYNQNDFDLKRVGGGWLMQSPDSYKTEWDKIQIVTKRKPTDQETKDMLFAWTVAKFVKSNAIVFASNGMTLGVGAGQMSRIDSARIASIKADNAGLSLKNSVAASDAFFPFRDGLDVIVQSGSSCIIQPGGSLRDNEVIEAANEHNIVMAMTGTRHFRH